MIEIRAATAADADAIARIYAPYVATSSVSFEDVAPDAEEIARRIALFDGLYPWLVCMAAEDGTLLGFAYASRFRERPAYRFTVETSVYVAGELQRNGIGQMLYAALLDTLEAQGFTQAIATIAIPNDGSIRLHEAMGFFRAGNFREIGYKQGQWRDVGYWQRELAAPSHPPIEPRPFSITGVIRN